MNELYYNFTSFNILKYIFDFRGAIDCYEINLVHIQDIVLGNQEKVVSSFYRQYFSQNHAYKTAKI